ncbi:DUF2164 domain-containing protein [Clostridium sp. MSJ-11]|uniref:DUF2164 domain-containing protein n=1 Tax=Clostridium mobile TaxID=2841512 RepID=A0ABS6EF05_9CLOT|nr:DUF2164 domain-containing protein [Clostridium mobile]MBU5483801.1 DUF2164 domain-containing protein [Clostridium mobile]
MKKIVLDKDKKKEMIESIKEYFSEERDEEIGDLAATLLLNFIIEELAGEFYNQGIEDAYRYMNDRVEDMLGLQK